MSRLRLRTTCTVVSINKSVTVSWVPTTIDAQGNAVVLTDAIVYWDTTSRSPGLGYVNSANVGSTASSKLITGLSGATIYYFAVSEIDAAGNSYPSQEFTFTTPA